MRRFNSALILGLLLCIMVSPLTVMGAPTRQDVIITFSVGCINDSGGAVLHPGATTPTVSNTFAIANVLNITDAWFIADALLPDRILKENMTAWIEELQVTSPVNSPDYGGFLASANSENSTLSASYFAIQALDRLNETDSINSAILFDFIVRLQRTNATLYPDTVGGFSDKNGTIVTVAATYFAIQILEIFGELNQINTTLAIAWINSSQSLQDVASPSYGGFVNGRNSSTADLQTTFMALKSLEILDALDTINQTAVIDYILPHYRENANYPQYYGGFGLTPDTQAATHWATYYAVAALHILGAENQLSTDSIAAWILSTQTTDGGFADETDAVGFAPQTNLAVSTLVLLDQLQLLLVPIGIDLFVFPWWIVGIVAIIAIIVVFVIFARRAEWF